MDEILKNKLFNHQAKPPVAAWDNIANKLDELDLDTRLSNKILALETLPPSNAWENILSILDKNKIKPIVAGSKKKATIISILKYAVAASIAGIILFGVNVFFNNKIDSTAIGLNKVSEKPTITGTQTKEEEDPSIKNLLNDPIVKTENKIPGSAQIKASRYNASKINPGIRIYTVNTMSSSDIPTPSISTKLSETIIENDLSAAIASLNEIDNNRYLQFIGADGNLIKMPKKIATLLGCVVGPNLSVGVACLEQVKTWREKIINSPINASADNFMDIIGIINSIKDNP